MHKKNPDNSSQKTIEKGNALVNKIVEKTNKRRQMRENIPIGCEISSPPLESAPEWCSLAPNAPNAQMPIEIALLIVKMGSGLCIFFIIIFKLRARFVVL